MKYTPKFQNGGGFATFTPYINPTQQQSQTPSASKNAEGESVMDDKIYDKLIGNGLASDVNEFAAKMGSLQKDFFGGAGFSGKPVSSYLSQIAKINEIKENKDAWVASFKSAEASGGLGEAAIGTSNEVYTRDDTGKIKAINLKTYKDNKDKIKLLSVSELLNARNFENQLAGQNSVFEVANSSIGIDKISDHIQSIVNMVGLASDTTDFYATKDVSNEIAKITGGRRPTQKEFEALSSITMPGAYKITSTTKEKDLTTALNYIWSTLGEPSKRKLNLMAVSDGIVDEKGNTDPTRAIKQLLTSHYAPESSVKIDEVKDASGNKVDSTGKSIKTSALTPTELFHLGKLNLEGNTYEINNNKGAKMKIHASSVGPLLDLKNNEVIGTATIADSMSKGGLSTLVDLNKAYLGNTKIDPNQLQNLVHSANDDVAQVFLPVKYGTSIPDLESMQEFSDLMTVFETNKGKETIKAAEDRFRKAGFDLKIDSIPGNDGKMVKVIRDNKFVKPFLAIPALTNSATDFVSNPSLVKLSGTEGDIATQLMEEAWTYTTGSAAKPITKQVIPSKWNSLESPLAGMIYIAYRPDAPAQITAMNSHLYGLSANIVDVQRNLREYPNMLGNSPVNGNAKQLIK